MEKLSPTWLTEKWVDYEYKQYILLAYLQHVNEQYRVQKLYPILDDLRGHYDCLLDIRNKQKMLKNKFPQELTSIDVVNFNVKYKELVEDDKVMDELNRILAFGLLKLKDAVYTGEILLETIKSRLSVTPVGILATRYNEGYVLVKQLDTIHAFDYNVGLYNTKSKCNDIKLEPLGTYELGMAYSCKDVKLDLLDQYDKYSNPATFMIETEVNIPLEETYIPIAKRKLAKHLSRF